MAGGERRDLTVWEKTNLHLAKGAPAANGLAFAWECKRTEKRPKRAPVARQLSLLPTDPIVTTGSPLRPRKHASSTTCAVSDAPDLEEVLPRDANASERGQGIQAADDIAAAALSRE